MQANAARKMTVRALANLGGVSDRTLEKQLNWIRAHPEVPVARYVARSFATRCGNYRVSRDSTPCTNAWYA